MTTPKHGHEPMSPLDELLFRSERDPAKRSTLSDANAKRPWQVFGDVFAALLEQAHRGLRRAGADAVRLIDSTSVRLSSLSADWATFSADVFGAKAHIVYDPRADRPIYFAVTPSRVRLPLKRTSPPPKTGAKLSWMVELVSTAVPKL